VATANTWRTQRPRTSSGFGTTASQHSEDVRPKCYQGIIRCRPKNSEAVALRSGAHGGLMCPLEKGVRGIETSGSGYLQDQIRGGRKGRAERQGLGQSPNKTTGYAPRKSKAGLSFSLGFHYISRLAAANIGCASEEEKEFSSSLGFHYICKKN